MLLHKTHQVLLLNNVPPGKIEPHQKVDMSIRSIHPRAFRGTVCVLVMDKQGDLCSVPLEYKPGGQRRMLVPVTEVGYVYDGQGYQDEPMILPGNCDRTFKQFPMGTGGHFMLDSVNLNWASSPEHIELKGVGAEKLLYLLGEKKMYFTRVGNTLTTCTQFSTQGKKGAPAFRREAFYEFTLGGRDEDYAYIATYSENSWGSETVQLVPVNMF